MVGKHKSNCQCLKGSIEKQNRVLISLEWPGREFSKRDRMNATIVVYLSCLAHVDVPVLQVGWLSCSLAALSAPVL